MSRRFERHYATPGVLVDRARGIVLDFGLTVPADATVGYAPGCLFLDIDAAAGLQLWVNEGTRASCAFKALASTAAGTFATLLATAGTITTLTSTTANVTTLNPTNVNLSVGASTAAAGTDTTNATALPAGTATIYPTTAADDTKGVKITASDQVTGRALFIGNGVSNKILKVYGPTGAVINGAAADAAFSTVSGKGCWITCLSGSGNTWLAA